MYYKTNHMAYQLLLQMVVDREAVFHPKVSAGLKSSSITFETDDFRKNLRRWQY